MPKQINKLTAMQVKKAKYSPDEKDKLSDGGGLHLYLHPNGSKYWRLNYRRPVTQKQNTLALGVYGNSSDGISLEQARQKRDEAKKLLAQGIDPAEQRNEQKRQDKTTYENTFEPFAKQWLKHRELEQRDDSENIRRLSRDVFPHIGHMPLLHITTEIIEAKIMQPFLDRGAVESAHRVKSNLNMIFELAKRKKIIKENPVRDVYLPKTIKGNFAARVEPDEVSTLLKKIWSYTADRPKALFQTEALTKLSVLVFLRPTEIRTLKWSNYDRNDKTIKLTTSKLVKTKNHKPEYIQYNHIIPLAHQAIEILEELYKVTGDSEYMFATNRTAKAPLSTGTITGALNRMGFSGKQTPHGLRATAKTMMKERLHINNEFIEKQLGHVVKDSNGTAYDRTKYLSQRDEMMQRWADYIDELRTGAATNIIEFKKAE